MNIITALPLSHTGFARWHTDNSKIGMVELLADKVKIN